MASGHVNRTKRPNTWLHRPACGREESPCQPGAVHTWHFSAVPTAPSDVRFQGVKQPCRRNPETAEVDPQRTSAGGAGEPFGPPSGRSLEVPAVS
jgi:hypothetical protein